MIKKQEEQDSIAVERLKSAIAKGLEVSPLGKQVAEILNYVFVGLYHMSISDIVSGAWHRNDVITLNIGWVGWSTYDYDLLTKLVFCAHRACIRIDMKPVGMNYMRISFSKRERNGDLMTGHPRLDDAVANFNETVTFPEYGE